MKGCVVVKT